MMSIWGSKGTRATMVMVQEISQYLQLRRNNPSVKRHSESDDVIILRVVPMILNDEDEYGR